jgi:hypothetical protein
MPAGLDRAGRSLQTLSGLLDQIPLRKPQARCLNRTTPTPNTSVRQPERDLRSFGVGVWRTREPSPSTSAGAGPSDDVLARKPAHSRRLVRPSLLLVDAAQMRWNTSVPRTQRPAKKAVPLATTVVGLTKRPDQLVVTLQSDVQFREV